MSELSPDLKEWMIIEGYGKVLGRSGLTLLDREFINFSFLSTRFYDNQLYSHAKGCLNLGADKDDLIILFTEIKKTIIPGNIGKVMKVLEAL